jgi:arylsulfatase A-like enzyme
MRFTQAYTAGAVCSPTRGSIMTGKYPVRTGVTDYIPGLRPNNAKLVTQPTRRELPLEERTVAEALQSNGYQTFYSGKWHLGGDGFGPKQQGFEVVVDDASLGNYGKDPLVGDRLTDSAIEFLDERDDARPFFMYLGYHEPHTPILAHPNHIERFRKKAATLPTPQETSIPERRGQSRLVQDDPAYACEIAVLDDAVRRLTEKLAELKLDDETVFIFFSDNGGLCTKDNPGPTSNLPLRSGKGWLYEGGIRVPLIVRAPGVTKAGTSCDAPVISTDFFPTLLQLAGAPLEPQSHVDGCSFLPLLRGEAPAERTLYWHYPHYHGSTWAPGSAIRDGNWKLIEFLDEQSVELYELSRDLGERHNLATSHPEEVERLRAKLNAWRDETGAFLPTPNPDFRADGNQPSGKKAKAKKKRDE